MSSNTFFTLFTLTALFSFGKSSASNAFSDKQIEAIGSFVETVMDCRNIPGLTLSVTINGSSWSRGFGYADFKTESDVTGKTLFGIGSLTKAFTAVLLGNVLNSTR